MFKKPPFSFIFFQIEHFSRISENGRLVFSSVLCNRNVTAMTQKNQISTFLLTVCLLLAGCDMIEYHPYDLDIDGETGINEKNIAIIEETGKGRKEFAFAVISDTQR